jgi:parallel beta-helix repeat protein
MTTMAEQIAYLTAQSELSNLLESDKFGILSVKNYGAVGDGTTDDTESIQDTIDAAVAAGGAIVFFPQGTYYITSALSIAYNDTKLIGVNYADGSNILLEGSMTGIDIDNVIGLEIEDLNIRSNGTNVGTGIYVHGTSRKIYIRSNTLRNLATGIMISGAWTTYVIGNNINDCTRGIACYKRSDEVNASTTIYIKNNTLWDNDTYNISIGETGLTNYSAGTQVETLVIADNVLDNVGSHIGNGCYNVEVTGNHTESPSNDYCWYLEGAVHNVTFRNNLMYDAPYGIYFDGDDFKNITINNNYFNTITKFAIYALECYLDMLIINNNRYLSTTYKIAYPYRSSTKEVAESVSMSGDEYGTILDGQIITYASAKPTSGRYKHGSICYNTNRAIGDPVGWYFLGAATWGFNKSTAVTDAGCDADSTTNTVTPTDITKFQLGDYVEIPGADTGPATLYAVIDAIDYVAGTFEVDPSVKVTVTGQTITISQGTWYEFSQIGYRTNAGSPSGVLTPRFIGEEVFDSTNSDWYKSIGLTNTDWVALN